MDIGQRLKEKGQETNLTQKELAEILFVSRQISPTHEDFYSLAELISK